MEFRLPELGEGVHEGELVKWQVKPGDQIVFDQPLCEIMTDKATVEIPSALKGKVGVIHVKEGDIVHVGQLMLSLEGAGEAGVAAAVGAEAGKPGELTSPHTGVGAEVAAAAEDLAKRALASPAVRRLAQEQNVVLDPQWVGSGPKGRILLADVLELAGPASPTKATVRAASSSSSSATFSHGSQAEVLVKSPLARLGTSVGVSASHSGLVLKEARVPFRGLRKKIAEKMRLSRDRAAHFTYVEEADATALVQLRALAKVQGAKHGVKVTFLPFVMKAMVEALRSYPILNSSLDEERGELHYRGAIHIGLSVQTEDGLMAPVVKDVAFKSILQIAKEIEGLVERARTKRLAMEDLQGSTITLTNAGSIGGLFSTPVINYPEVAILGFNKIFRKPVVRMEQGKEAIVIRDWTYFSLSLDHRVVDGAIGAEFMKVFIELIENPSLLLLGGSL